MAYTVIKFFFVRMVDFTFGSLFIPAIFSLIGFLTALGVQGSPSASAPGTTAYKIVTQVPQQVQNINKQIGNTRRQLINAF
jgi:hypothetical protein